MPCYYPRPGWLSQGGGKVKFYETVAAGDGTKRRLRKEPHYSGPDWARDLNIPCGKCIGCKLDRSKQWAIRLMHEAQLHKENCFITLTYETTSLPAARELEDSPRAARRLASRPARDNDTKETNRARAKTRTHDDSLSKRDAQLFMKRLRKHLTTRNQFTKVKHYLVGEYGDKKQRPHYHAAIFGEEFAADRYPIAKTPAGHTIYRSPSLEKLWPYGYSSIGELTFESAAYIARYIMKKITGNLADDHYKRIDEQGSNYWIEPEFAIMSRGGRKGKGIGHGWWEKYSQDVLAEDKVIMRGKPLKPPRYYDNQIVAASPFKADLIKLVRELRAATKQEDNTPARLKAKEAVAQARLTISKRSLEK